MLHLHADDVIIMLKQAARVTLLLKLIFQMMRCLPQVLESMFRSTAAPSRQVDPSHNLVCCVGKQTTGDLLSQARCCLSCQVCLPLV